MAEATVAVDGGEVWADDSGGDRLGEIKIPASLLVGDLDFPPLIESNRQAAARIPGCQLTVVPGMDHLPPLRDPGLVRAIIAATLSRAAW